MNNYYNKQNPINYNNIVWVIGVEGARAYQIPFNSSVLMLDSENEGIMYIKTSDNIGMCNIRLFKFEECTETPQNSNDYITREEFEQALNKLREGVQNEQTISAVKSEPKHSTKAIITE